MYQVILANNFSQSARKEISEIKIHTMWQRAPAKTNMAAKIISKVHTFNGIVSF